MSTSATTIAEIITAYRKGSLSDAELIQILTTFPYATHSPPIPRDDPGWWVKVTDSVLEPNTWEEVYTAYGAGLIPASIYFAVDKAKFPEADD